MCEYCEKGYSVKGEDLGMKMNVHIGMRDGKMKLSTDVQTRQCFHSVSLTISFCPMCGRDLRGAE